MVEIANMSQWKWLTMIVMVKTSAKIEPFQVSKGNEICFIVFVFYYYFAIAAVRDSPVLDK